MKTQVSIVKCSDYQTSGVIEAVNRAVGLLGGMESFVKPGERILLKPNLLSARQPERGVTTHPEVVRAVARLVKNAGAVPVIGDSPGGATKGVERVWIETGMKKLSVEENIELVNFETSGAFEKKIGHPLLPSIHISKIPFQVDGIINLPKLKTHNFAIFTGAIKNFYGLIPGLRKTEYHKIVPPYENRFGQLLAEIYKLIKDKVRLNLIDGIVAMQGNGPASGELRKLEMIAAGADTLSVDTAVTRILGFKPGKIEMIRAFCEDNLGQGNLENIDILGDKISQFNVKDFKFPTNWHVKLIPRSLIGIIGKFVWLKPVIINDLCKDCSMCVESCPVKAIGKTNSVKPVVNHKLCISCLCCHELCPHNAIELKSSLLTRLLIRRR